MVHGPASTVRNGSRVKRAFVLVLCAAFVAGAVQISARQQKPAAPLFRTGVDLVMVDVIVRDRSGNVVRNLKPGDFELIEDGKPQSISSFDFEEVTTTSKPMDASAILEVGKVKLVKAEPPKDPVTKEDLAGRRLVILLFDASSMQPEDVQRAIDSAVK